MSFNGLQPAGGPFYLDPGQSMRIWVRRNTRSYGGVDGLGSDMDAQWIMANPIRTPDATNYGALQVSDFAKELSYVIGWISINAGVHDSGFDPGSWEIIYWVTVTNISTSGSFFDIQGGGNT